MGGLHEERFGGSGSRGEIGMGEWRRLVETAVKQDQCWKKKEINKQRPVSVPASPRTLGVKRRATTYCLPNVSCQNYEITAMYEFMNLKESGWIFYPILKQPNSLLYIGVQTLYTQSSDIIKSFLPLQERHERAEARRRWNTCGNGSPWWRSSWGHCEVPSTF